MAAVQTTITELPDSRVRVDVQVAAEELQRRVERTASELGRSMKLPGFRKGKVPAPLVLQRVGREAVLDETVRSALPSWYAGAIEASKIVPVGDPKIDVGTLPQQGAALEFSIEIGVLPKAELGEYSGLEVARGEATVAEAEIDAEIESLRERLARLETVERAAAEGDFVVVDYAASLTDDEEDDDDDAERTGAGAGEPGGATSVAPGAIAGGEGRDQLVELAGNLIPGFQEGLLGAEAGEARTLQLTFPEDFSDGELAGRDSQFEVTVKEVKSRRLPEIDDDLAIDAGFDDIGQLRESIGAQLLAEHERRVQDEFREAALDAAVAQAQVPVTADLIEARAREMWERMLHSLSHQGVSREAYLKVVGRQEAEVLAEMAPEAEQALRREAVLTAVVAQEGIEPSEEDLLEAITPTAEREGLEPQKVISDLRERGRLEEMREGLAARQAIDLIAERAKPIAAERARAKEKLWTPGEKDGGEAAAAPGRLWTPDR